MTGVRELAIERRITRLCHLTPFRNLLQIAQGGGIRSTTELRSDERTAFDPQDLIRLDGHPDHISCSVEYPNVWYLASRRRDATPLQRLFPAWVCLLIEPAHLWRDDTLMCHRNAAAARGGFIRGGPEAFESLFENPVLGAGGWISRDRKPNSCPTDDQAEVLVHKAIPLADACHIVVADETQARATYAALDLIGVPMAQLRWSIAPMLFQSSLSRTLRSGIRPTERPWTMEDGAP
jgi:hypothetical protein